MAPLGGSKPPRRRLSEGERRRQIIDAAVEEVAERGYEAASLTRIAARAGVAKGLIWHYFSGKDDLMESGAKATMTTMRDDIVAKLDLAAPVPDIIRAALRCAALQVRTHRIELIAVNRIVHNLLRSDSSADVVADVYEDIHRGQEALFRRGQTEGSLAVFDIRVMAVTYQGSIDAMLDHLERHPDVDPEEYAAVLAEVLLSGMSR